MSNQQDDFNFEEFAVKAIAYIDSIRSYQQFSTKPTESRINAFYRAVGLPALMPPSVQDFDNGEPQDKNNGNLGDNKTKANYGQLARFIHRQDLYDSPIEKNEAENFLNFNEENPMFSILYGPNGKPKRVRGCLFPMYVDGRIHVFPKNRRFGKAFLIDKELENDSKHVIHRRPLIETIIHIKLKGSSAVDKNKQEQINKDFGGSILQNAAASIDSKSLMELGNNSGIRLEDALDSIAKVFEKAVLQLNRVRGKVSFNIIPTVANVAEQNPIVKSSDELDQFGELDLKLLQIEDKDKIENTILALFEYGEEQRNLTGEGLTSSFLSLLSPSQSNTDDSDNTSENIKEDTNNQIERAKAELKSAYRTLELLLGTFASISGIDIMIVMLALYELDTADLIAMLDEKSQNNLEKIKGLLPEIESAKKINMVDAVTRLQKKVRALFNNLVERIQPNTISDKIRYQDVEEEK